MFTITQIPFRSQLFYQCQISITIKEPGSECPRPQCPEPQGFGAVRVRPRQTIDPIIQEYIQQGGGPTAGTAIGAGGGPAPAGGPRSNLVGVQRLLKKRSTDDIQTMDVRAEINTMDISPGEFSPETVKDILPFMASPILLHTGVCLSPAAFSLLASGIVFLTAAVGVGAFFVVRPRKTRKS